ncbi:MAG: helicase-associated domain-containing protein [Chloroflexi bacterium]|nr:helicase-associated domain-containing protein [Chloroflexota bacterium]
MPSLSQSLDGKDLGHIRMVAELWGIELVAKDARAAIKQLCESLLTTELVTEIVEALPDNARLALGELQVEGGRSAWGAFSRRNGEVRELGPARRDKEQPQRNPASTSERLWYRAMIGRAFFDTAEGAREFAYIPADLLSLLPAAELDKGISFGRPARPVERAAEQKANDQILDEASTLLAARRICLSADTLSEAEAWRSPSDVLAALLQAAGILGADGQPISETTRNFLAAERGTALALLATAWLESEDFNELRLLPGLAAEGDWRNQPVQARHKVIGFLQSALRGEWWSLPALIADVKARQADFQRPAGDYDSWYLKDKVSGNFLRGFAHWDQIDGALIGYLVRGPLHWLGIVDLAGPKGEEALAFRFSAWAEALLYGSAPKGLAKEDAPLVVDSQGQIQVPRLTSRAVRYQVARFCEWEAPKRGMYVYRVRAASLERSREQGLEVRQLLGLLKAHSEAALPPNLLQALQRWEKQGTQAKMGPMLVLRLSSAAIMKALRASRAARYLGEPLGPTTIQVKDGASRHVLQALTELGYLGKIEEYKS